MMWFVVSYVMLVGWWGGIELVRRGIASGSGTEIEVGVGFMVAGFVATVVGLHDLQPRVTAWLRR